MSKTFKLRGDGHTCENVPYKFIRYSKRASNSMSCLMLPSQNCKGESERGNHLNYKICMVHWTNNWHWHELFEVIPGKKKGILWYQISKFFLNRWKVFQKKKKMITAIISFDLFLLSRQLFHLPTKKEKRKKKGNYFIWLKNHYKLRNAMFTVFLQHIYNKL